LPYIHKYHLNDIPHLSNVPSGSDWKLGGKLLNINTSC